MSEEKYPYSRKPLPKCATPNWLAQNQRNEHSSNDIKRTKTSLKSLKKRNQQGPIEVASLLQSILDQFKPVVKKKSKALSIEQLQELWIQVVGPDYAAMSHVIRFRQGVLSVKVSFAPLLAELRAFAGTEIQSQLAEAGISNLCELRFVS